jgi:hypothetical protein
MNVTNVMPDGDSDNKINLQNSYNSNSYWSVGFCVLSTCQKFEIIVTAKIYIINVAVIN